MERRGRLEGRHWALGAGEEAGVRVQGERMRPGGGLWGRGDQEGGAGNCQAGEGRETARIAPMGLTW